MTLSLADRSNKAQKVKVLPIAGKDPDAQRSEMIKVGPLPCIMSSSLCACAWVVKWTVCTVGGISQFDHQVPSHHTHTLRFNSHLSR